MSAESAPAAPGALVNDPPQPYAPLWGIAASDPDAEFIVLMWAARHLARIRAGLLALDELDAVRQAVGHAQRMRAWRSAWHLEPQTAKVAMPEPAVKLALALLEDVIADILFAPAAPAAAEDWGPE